MRSVTWITIHVFFSFRSWKLPSTFVSLSFCDPRWMNAALPPRRRWRTGLDLRDRWVGPAATCSSRPCQTAAVCLWIAPTHALTHSHSKQSVTHPVTLIQKHKCIHSHTAIHPKQSALLRCPAKGATCSDTQFKSYGFFNWNGCCSLYLYSVLFFFFY